MKYNRIRGLIKNGATKEAILAFDAFRNELDSLTIMELDAILSRYNCLNTYLRTNQISFEEGNRELSRINYALLQIIEDLENRERGIDIKNKELHQIETLAKAYIESKKIQNNAARLREKNQIVKKICQLLIKAPDLIDQLSNSHNHGIIAGIAYRINLMPNIEDLKILKELANRATGNYTKGYITNAIGELVYTGQMRIGDDQIIQEMLADLKVGADLPLSKNVERVEAALQYFVQ